MKKYVVVDSSVMIKWIFEEPDSKAAKALLAQWIDEDFVMIEPPLLACEMANVLHQNADKGEVSIEEAKRSLIDIMELDLEFEVSRLPELSIRAIEIARKCTLNAVYDAHYVALAERKKCEFWTADIRLWKPVHKDFPWVRLLDEFKLTN
jgi:predicted nucleic acid-binding protein